MEQVILEGVLVFKVDTWYRGVISMEQYRFKI